MSSYQQYYTDRSQGEQVNSHSYPPNMGSPNSLASDDMTPPRNLRQHSSSEQSSQSSLNGDDGSGAYGRDGRGPPGGGHSYSNTYNGSQPSLPRYGSSGGQSTASSLGSPGGYVSNPSRLNPRGVAPRYRDGIAGGYGSGHNGSSAHPLSNTTFLESSPTLADSDTLASEKVRFGAGDQRGDYLGPHLTSGAAVSSNYRRSAVPTGRLSGVYRRWSGAVLADSGADERHVKLPRLGYLDGLKFLAAWVVLNATLFDNALSPNQLSAIQRNSPLYITRSFGLGLTFLLLLSGRSLATPLWDVNSPTTTSLSPSMKPGTALISWPRLTRAMLVRPFRFVLPVIAVAALQWGLGAGGKLSQSNAVGMDEPYWGLISSFSGFATLVFDLFTFYEQDTRAGRTFGANLWTVPWFFQSSYAVYIIHLMLGNLSSNRYWVYAILATFSWATYNYFFVAVLGMVIADMHAHGHLHTIRTKWPTAGRLALHASLITIALVTQWVPIVRDNINMGLAIVNVQNHPELTFCDSIFAVCFLFCIETSGVAQLILGNVVMRNLGKLAAGMYLLAPAIVFAIVPPLAISLNSNGSSTSATLGISWVVLFGCGVGFAVLFHFLVELPSKWIGEVVAEVVEKVDTSDPNTKSKGGKLLKKNVGGGAAKPVLA